MAQWFRRCSLLAVAAGVRLFERHACLFRGWCMWISILCPFGRHVFSSDALSLSTFFMAVFNFFCVLELHIYIWKQYVFTLLQSKLTGKKQDEICLDHTLICTINIYIGGDGYTRFCDRKIFLQGQFVYISPPGLTFAGITVPSTIKK